MTENAELVSEAAPPLDRDKLEALQFSSNYIFNQIFFFFPPTKQLQICTWLFVAQVEGVGVSGVHF